ncbi:DUF4401 domain-containing protein [uncultured Tenacibaculum sp.]|uniref:DUF4401 domain-containing protein n=1 Tax=uncultured Tenacibaculum sp. TaxID=174713 RepID=UPI002613445F|nr:DUF4401 domain-containing protein [uncultured Tenacibaculum sp.]
MEKITNKQALLDRIRFAEGAEFEYNEAAILDAYKAADENKASLAIKILSILGGVLAMLAFLAFLVISGLYSSEIVMTVVGSLSIASAIVINKISQKLILDTFSISIYITGFVLLAFSLSEIHVGENSIAIIIGLIALSALVITQNYIVSFVSILILNGSFLFLLLNTEVYDLIHVYIAITSFILTYVFLNEAKIISATKKLAQLYYPIRIGVLISFIIGVSIVGKKGGLPLSQNYIWISSIIFISIGMYVVSIIGKINGITAVKTKGILYVFSFLILLSTLFSPAISGAMLLVLLCFLVNYKTGFVIGILALVYFVSQYYYDLSFTLLTKSILLLVSGVLFLACYLFTTKMLGNNEKI